MKKHKAFSLVELSIVIIIIGILIAGVTQGSRMINISRINMAQSSTNSSPIVSIKDLVLWHETTTDKAIDANEAVDGENVSTLYDINPQSQLQHNSIRTQDDQNAAYTEDVLNGLPMLSFNGNNDQYVNANVEIGSDMSIFAVIRIKSAKTARIVHNENHFMLGIRDQELLMTYGSGTGWNHHTVTFGSDSQIDINKYHIIASVLKNSTNTGYVNGTNVGSFSESKPATSKGLSIGGYYLSTENFYGNIGELIIFNKGLTNTERQSVENYLSQKWGITISQ